MADDLTPTTEQVQNSYVFGILHGESIEQRRGLFRAWLAQHDAELAAAVRRPLIDHVMHVRAEASDRVHPFGMEIRAQGFVALDRMLTAAPASPDSSKDTSA